MNFTKKKTIWTIVIALVLCLFFAGRYYWNLGNKGRGPLMFLPYVGYQGQIGDSIYETEQLPFEVENQEQTIRGTIFTAKGHLQRRGQRVLIYTHSFNCPASALFFKANALAEAGLITVTFDCRGGSSKSQSDGRMTDMTVDTEVDDLCHVLDYVRQQSWADSLHIYLMGESQGGLVTALTAAKRQQDVAAAILCYPALHEQDAAREHFKTKADIPDSIDVAGGMTGRRFWEYVYNLDIMGNITRYEGPVLILHGTKDQMVDYHYSVRANEQYRNSTLVLISEAGHGFGGMDAETSLRTMYQFIMTQPKIIPQYEETTDLTL